MNPAINHQPRDASPTINDAQRGSFLRALDDSNLVITDWESQFIESFLAHDDRPQRLAKWWTPGRRTAVDKIIHKYRHDLEIPLLKNAMSVPSVSSVPSVASENGCEYLVETDSRYVPCNAPATHKLPRTGFRYCDQHAAQVTENMKRRGKTIHLEKI